MNVRVRLFAQQRQLTGWRERTIELPEGSPISAAWAALVREWPVLAPGTDSVRFARNAVYADASEVLADGDELAVIPPVAGGSAPAAGSATATGSVLAAGSALATGNAPAMAGPNLSNVRQQDLSLCQLWPGHGAQREVASSGYFGGAKRGSGPDTRAAAGPDGG